MADNVAVRDAAGASKTMDTREAAGVHTPRHLEDATQRAALHTLLGTLATQTTLASVLAALNDIKTYTDGLEGSTDGLETLIAATNTALTTLNGYMDGVETLLGTLATASAQSTGNTALANILSAVDGLEALVTATNAKDFATQTTLAAVLAKIIAAPATEAKQDSLAALVGEVQASPTANTVLDRLKTLATSLTTIAGHVDGLETLTGAVNETAPASDTASSGLNGRLQRIAQRLTSAIALLPASLGQKAKASALAVTLASDEDLLTVLGAVTASPTANTVNARLKDLLTGIILAAGSNIIGKVGIDQTTNGTTNAIVRAMRSTKALSSAAVSASSSGDNTVIAAVSGQTTRVHRIFLVAAGAVNITIKRGSTSLTGAMPAGTICLDFSEEPYFVTAANEAFIVNLSGAVAVTGMVEYVTSA